LGNGARVSGATLIGAPVAGVLTVRVRGARLAVVGCCADRCAGIESMVGGASIGTSAVVDGKTGAARLDMSAIIVDTGAGASGTPTGSGGSAGFCRSRTAITAATPSVPRTKAAKAVLTDAVPGSGVPSPAEFPR
jgi:hypothetical protein